MGCVKYDDDDDDKNTRQILRELEKDSGKTPLQVVLAQPLPFLPSICSSFFDYIQLSLKVSSLFVVYEGLKDQGVESEFEWSDRSAVDYTYWKDWNPDNWGNAEDCANVRSDNDGRWNDQSCWNNLPYICKRPKGLLVGQRDPF